MTSNWMLLSLLRLDGVHGRDDGFKFNFVWENSNSTNSFFDAAAMRSAVWVGLEDVETFLSLASAVTVRWRSREASYFIENWENFCAFHPLASSCASICMEMNVLLYFVSYFIFIQRFCCSHRKPVGVQLSHRNGYKWMDALVSGKKLRFSFPRRAFSSHLSFYRGAYALSLPFSFPFRARVAAASCCRFKIEAIQHIRIGR